MSDNNIPKSHGRFGHEEMGMEFTAPEQKKEISKSRKSNFFSKFKKSKKKSNEAARQNLE